ncbi:MAG: EboA domain-containing protein [Pseudomonadota bacterium]
MPPTPVDLLRRWVQRQARAEAWAWLDERLAALEEDAGERDLYIVLGLIPRRLGKADLALTSADLEAAAAARDGWDPRDWSLDGAARVLALLCYQGDGRPFPESFKQLRRTADARELIALYRGLPLYPGAEALEAEAGEGLRSNMRAVFESIAHHNPFPRDVFDDHRWNHMVLKALFVGSRLDPIVGLDARANPELARIMRDYAHERWAAGRKVTPELWRCVGPFAEDDAALSDLERALGGDADERRGAALALAASPAPGAKALLHRAPDLEAAIARGELRWDRLQTLEAVA